MSRPRLLDLFCCQGGAAMGYHRAGFDVVGIDIDAQPKFPFGFIQADALSYLAEHGHEFDAIHASPPCQRYSAITPKANRQNHPDLLAPTRDLLNKIGKPYVIENVVGSPMFDFFTLCGTMFGLCTPCGAQLRRHRQFETNWFIGLIPQCQHNGKRPLVVTGQGAPVGGQRHPVISIYGDKARDRAVGQATSQVPRVITVTGKGSVENAARCIQERSRTITVTGSTAQQNVEHNVRRETFSVADARIAMGIDWMGMEGLSQAIPPAYTEFIGRTLLLVVQEGGAK